MEDDNAGEAFESVIGREYNRELHKALFECLNSLDGQQRRCIVGKYFDGRRGGDRREGKHKPGTRPAITGKELADIAPPGTHKAPERVYG